MKPDNLKACKRSTKRSVVFSLKSFYNKSIKVKSQNNLLFIIFSIHRIHIYWIASFSSTFISFCVFFWVIVRRGIGRIRWRIFWFISSRRSSLTCLCFQKLFQFLFCTLIFFVIWIFWRTAWRRTWRRTWCRAAFRFNFDDVRFDFGFCFYEEKRAK